MKNSVWIAIAAFLLFGLPARATVTGTNNTVSYTCSGSTGPYAFTYPAFDSSSIDVIQTVISTSTSTTLPSSSYTITPVNNSYMNGGSVTLNTACPTGDTLTIQRNTEKTQLDIFTNYMPTLYQTFESGLDKLTMEVQDALSVTATGCVVTGAPGPLLRNNGLTGCSPAAINDNGTTLTFSEQSTQPKTNGVLAVDGQTYTSISSAFVALGSNPGIIDNSGCLGSLTIPAITLTTKQGLILGPCAYSLTGLIKISGNSAFIRGTPNGSVYSGSPGATVLQQAANTNLALMVSVTGADDSIRDVLIDGNKAGPNTGTVGISVTGTRLDFGFSAIRNTASHGFSAGSLSTPDLGQANHVHDDVIDSVGGSAIYFAQTVDQFLGPNLELENSGRYCLEIQGADSTRATGNIDCSGGLLGGLYGSGSSGFESLWNSIIGWQFGDNSGPDIQIVNNSASSMNPYAFSWTIVGNHFIGLNSGATTNTISSIVVRDSGYNIIADNDFTNNGGPTYKYGIDIGVTTGLEFPDLVQGNRFFGTFGTGDINALSNTQLGPNVLDNDKVQFAFPNNDWIQWFNSAGALQNIIELGADNNAYVNAPSGQAVNIQVGLSNVGTFSATGLALPGDMTSNTVHDSSLSNGCVQIVATLMTSTGVNCGGITIATSGVNNAVQSTLNFIPSSVNALGMIITPVNPATTGNELFEFSGTPTGAWNFSGATWQIPASSGFVSNSTSTFGIDTLNHNVHVFINGTDLVIPTISGSWVNGNCPKELNTSSQEQVADNGAPCGSGGASIFASYQFGTQTPITGTANYLQTTYPSIFTTTQTGSGTSGSPFVDAITLTSQTANFFWAAPNGSAGAPVFRAIVVADVPTLNQSTTGNSATATAAQGTPTNCGSGQGATGIAASFNATGCTTYAQIAGDLGGTGASPTVTNLSHVTNSSLANSGLANPATTVNGQPCTLGGICTVTSAPSGSAGGDLSGTYPNPTVAQIEGAAIPASTAVVATNSGKQLIAATDTGINGVIQGLTGCNTIGYVYTPQAADCVVAGGGPGTGTQYYFSYWATTSTLGSAGSAITGQIPVINNGAAPTAASTGVGGRIFTGAGGTDSIACDSSTATKDRNHTIVYDTSTDTTVTVPSAAATGCGSGTQGDSNFTFAVAAVGSATITLNPTTSTYTILTGTSSSTGATTLALTQGQFATFNSTDNVNYIVRVTEGGGGGSGCTFSGGVQYDLVVANAPGGPCLAANVQVDSTLNNIVFPQPSGTTYGTVTALHTACYTGSQQIGNCGTSAINVLGVFNSSSGGYQATGWLSGIILDGTQSPAFGDIICASTTTGGEVHDNGPTLCGAVSFIGIVSISATSVTTVSAWLAVKTPNALGGSAGGDLTGTYPNPTIAANAVTGAKMANNTVTATQLAAQYSKWLPCNSRGLGDGLNAIVAGTYLQTTCYNNTGVTVTLTGIKCFTDNGGSSTLSATNGAGTALLTGAITCTSSYASGTQSGTTTIASGDFIKFTFVADGTTKQSDWVVLGTY